NPVLWLTSRDRVKNWLAWIFLGAMGLPWMWGLIVYPSEWKVLTAYVWTSFILHLVLKLWLAGEAGRRFCLDRQSGGRELLLGTPLRLKEIVRGQMTSLLWQFAGPVAVVICVDLVFLSSEPESDWKVMWVAG